MANNKVSSLLNKQLPRPPRSNFNLGRVNGFSADVGYVYPVYIEEVLPNSYKRLDVEGLIQSNATVQAFQGSFTTKLEAFFVPLRLYHRHLDLNSIRPDFHDDFNLHVFRLPGRGSGMLLGRQLGSVEGAGAGLSVSAGSLIDYLGLAPVGFNSHTWNANISVNGEPFIGYFDIWRNFYANPHDRRVPFRCQNFAPNVVSTDDSPVMPVVRYVGLDRFDDFVNYIVDNSVSNFVTDDSGIVPTAVNVWDVFSKFFIDDTFEPDVELGQSSYFESMPLFGGQAHRINSSSNASLDTSDGLHFGLLPSTYKDDYFNSRFLNEFVSYMQEEAVITVNDNKFNISQFRIANRIAKYTDKSIFSDTRFGSWIKAHFGVKSNSKLNIPQFLGSITSNIVFNDIYATAQTGEGSITSNQALGSRSSLGQGYVKNKGAFVEFQATEPGYLMVMFRIVPNVRYFQGIRKMYFKTSFNDLYKPEFDAVGYQPLFRGEMDAVYQYWPNNAAYLVDRFDAEIPAISPDILFEPIGQHPSWLEYMTAVDESHGLMTKRFEYGYWVNNRPYNPSAYDEVAQNNGTSWDFNFIRGFVPEPSFESSTYIMSEYFNTIFAVDKYTDNFQVQLRFFDKTKQPMSKQVLPSL